MTTATTGSATMPMAEPSWLIASPAHSREKSRCPRSDAESDPGPGTAAT